MSLFEVAHKSIICTRGLLSMNVELDLGNELTKHIVFCVVLVFYRGFILGNYSRSAQLLLIINIS